MSITLKDVYPNLEKDDKESILHGILMNHYEQLKETKALTILHVLYESHPEPVAINKLHIRMAISQYKLYEELARLEGAGFIFKKLDSSDRRITNVYISPQGLYVLQQHGGTK